MSSSAMIVAEMLITLGVCLGFGLHQLWDLKREKAKDAAKLHAAKLDAAELHAAESGREKSDSPA